MRAALLVFAKVPRPGQVKTRLTTELSPAEAARLYTAFLRDTMRQVRRLDLDVRLYLAPPLPEEGSDALPADVDLYEQQGDDLGSRMKQAVHEAFQEGYDQVVVMGSDHPTLPHSFLRTAFWALDDPNSICVGPTEDGGFYLLGMSAFYPQLFEDMSYSHAEVFSETLARAADTDATLTVLPQWYDVDRPPDLDRMLQDLAQGRGEAPNTQRMVEHLDVQIPTGQKPGAE